MKVVTTFHAPSSVISSVKCKLVPGDVEHLIVAKMTRLEVFSIQEDGLRAECDLDVWGSICSVKAVRRLTEDCSRLVVMLDHPQPELLFMDYKGAKLTLATAVELSTSNALQRPAEFCMDFFVSEEGSRIVASAYAGKLKVICLEDGLPTQLGFDASAYENNILALCFLPGVEKSIAILHTDAAQRVRLVARDLDVEEYEISAKPSLELPPVALNNSYFRRPDSDPTFLLPVPEQTQFRGGVLIVGGKRLLLYERADDKARVRHGKKRDTLEERLEKGNAKAKREAMDKQNERDLRKRKPRASVDWPWSAVAVCEAVSDTSFLIGDAYGRLAIVHLDLRDIAPCLVLVPLGTTSPPKSITHLSGSKVYIGSHFGDAQLIDVNIATVDGSPVPILKGLPTVRPDELDGVGPPTTFSDPTQDLPDLAKANKGKIIQTSGSYVSVDQTYTNIAPIEDAVLVDIDGSGQPQIVTCSGGYGAGRLHVVRNGADFQVLANAGDASAAHVSGIWPLKNMYDDVEHSHFMMDTPDGTQLFHIDSSSAQPTFTYESPADAGFLSERTLAVGNVRTAPSYGDSPVVVQVTTKVVHACEYKMELVGYCGLMGDDKTDTPTAACVAESQIFVAYPGGTLSYLMIEAQGEEYKLKLVARLPLRVGSEIAAISAIPPEPKHGKIPKQSSRIAVAYWDTRAIDIFRLKKSGNTIIAECIHTTDPLPALVRDLTVQHFRPKDGERHPPYLFAALADGTVVTYALRDGVTGDRKIVSLGDTPVSLTVYSGADGESAVFAAGQHAAVWSWEKQRLHHAAVLFRDVSAVAPLHTSHFKNALLLTGPAGLTIGCVREVDKMHIRTVPLDGYTPAGIAHDAKNKVFGVVASYTPPEPVGTDAEPMISSAFILFDDSTLQELQRHTYPEGTIPTAITLVPNDGSEETYFCVATYDPSAAQSGRRDASNSNRAPPNSGKIYLLGIARTSLSGAAGAQITVRVEREVISYVMQLTTVKGIIAAAVESAVIFFRPEIVNISSSSWALHKVGEWNHNFVVRTLAAKDDHLAIGDQMHSISIVKVSLSSNETAKLELISSDYSPLFPSSLELGENKSVITANVDLNLCAFSSTTPSLSGREVLERDGAFHLGEYVNKFIRGSLMPTETANARLRPSYVFFTSVGRIGVIMDIHGDPRLFTDLERNMAYVFRGVGVEHGPHEDHSKHRAPKNSTRGSDAEKSARGFVDGDFIEQLLLHPQDNDKIRRILGGANEFEVIHYSVDQIRYQLESLQSLH
ncbi:mono-functional DNA-alkylating methyl methanesulfonate N-term-domain-containing protein [Schizophyllum amplum]|uniref:Mono-functional DNA-alkylating methyl methanesulfonate N-term-domain-containing protein n=1 Tax=Schizophyllum amplum TaxID=97359 RepID=A0A550C8L2_9AGAR|nr:mono-functional DNA-alkylating methyl methanesulfonate N-term-domain-containing protein [Auriculariopsis ampla]